MQQFLNTPLGSYLKVLLTAVLTAILLKLQEGVGIDEISVKEWVGTMLVAVIPVVINWLNPADTRYGPNKES